MRTYETEPERCISCRSTQRMTFHHDVFVDGEERAGWLCDACGHVHVMAGARGTSAEGTLKVKPAKCISPMCGQELDALTSFGHKLTPKIGDLTVCAYCGTPAIFKEDFSLRPIEDADYEKMSFHDRLQLAEAIRVVRSIAEERRRKNATLPAQFEQLVKRRAEELGYSKGAVEKALEIARSSPERPTFDLRFADTCLDLAIKKHN